MALGALDLNPQLPLLNKWQALLFSGFLRAVYHTVGPLHQQLANCAGGGVLYGTGQSDPTVPDWFALDAGAFQVVAVAGTASAEQWCGNVLQVQQVSMPPYPGRVHQFFGQVANSIFLDLAAHFFALTPQKPCVLCGHSLGGAVAALVAARVRAQLPGRLSWVYTEGAPRPGDLACSLGLDFAHLAVENSGDLVPAVPPSQATVGRWLAGQLHWGPCQDYAAAGERWTVDPGGRIFPSRLAGLVDPSWGLVAQVLTQGVNPNALSHSVGNYCLRLARWIGGPPGAAGYPLLGIDVPALFQWMGDFSAVDGFVWPPGLA